MTMTPMIDNCVAAGLERAYNRMNPNQYVREIYQNSIEAGKEEEDKATDIRLARDQQAFDQLGVERGCIIDDGPGIPYDDILNKINRINSSSKDVGGVHDNFGIGLKVSALVPNSYGLVILCRTKERPKGFMIWLHIKNKAAGARHLVSEENLKAHQDPEEEAMLELEDRVDFAEVEKRGYSSYTVDGVDYMSWWENNVRRRKSEKQTGTAVIFLGKSQKENTFQKLVTSGIRFLNGRYLRYRVKPYVARCEIERNRHFDRVENPINILRSRFEELETIKFNGWTVKTYLKKENATFKSAALVKSPLVHAYFKEAVIYRDEVYGNYADLKPQSIAKVRSSWGIWSNKVGKRVTLLVYPPEYDLETGVGVFPDDSRTELLWRDSTLTAPTSKLPLEELREQYQKHMPEKIRDLLDDIALDELLTIKESKAAKMVSQWAKVPKDNSRVKKGAGVLIFDPKGDLFGSDGVEAMGVFGGNQGNIDSDSKEQVENPSRKKKEKTQEELNREAEQRRARERRKKAMNEPPQVVFKNQNDEDSEDRFKVTLETGEHNWEAAYYQPLVNGTQGNKLYINRDHPCFYSYQTMVIQELKSKGEVISRDSAQKHFIEPYFEEFGGCAVQQIKGYAQPSTVSTLLSPERLTQSLTGHHFHLKANLAGGSLRLLKEYKAKWRSLGKQDSA
jgi:hypothetical protein|tara:strand:- start:2431 stop:4461 length:2031 start_codon:yes stop_codon:yes gene_type:complete